MQLVILFPDLSSVTFSENDMQLLMIERFPMFWRSYFHLPSLLRYVELLSLGKRFLRALRQNCHYFGPGHP